MNYGDIQLKYNFSNKVNEYDSSANIQKNVANELVKLIHQHCDLQKFLKSKILDIGSGTGFICNNIRNYFDHLDFENINFYELDLSFEMLQKSIKFSENNFKICANFEKIPFEEQSFDLIISSFALQWTDNFDVIFTQISKLLKNNGILAIALPNAKSFDNFTNLPFKINKMPETSKLHFALNNNNFVHHFYYEEKIYEKFANPIQALKSFKKIGANNLLNFDVKEKLVNFANLRSFYLKNYQSNLSFAIDWTISYFIYIKND